MPPELAQCPHCKYPLVSPADTGTCPECGTQYYRQSLYPYADPVRAWKRLAIVVIVPYFVCVGAWLAYAWFAESLGMLRASPRPIFSGAVLCACGALIVTDRCAAKHIVGALASVLGAAAVALLAFLILFAIAMANV